MDDSGKVYTSVTDKLKIVSSRFGESYFERNVYNSIARVPKHLREVNEKAYEPQIIAIGPYHRLPRIQPHLEVMEEHKILYLKMLLERTGRGYDIVKKYVTIMWGLEEKARACYDVVHIDKNDFVEMMLLDACFIVELFRMKCLASTSRQREDDKTVLDLGWINVKLVRDLLLFENQLPFFVIQKFFEMTEMPNETKSFFEIIFDFFKCRLRMYRHLFYRPSNDKNFEHLLHLLHDHLVYIPPGYMICEVIEKKDRDVIRCATELQEAGIEFKMIETVIMFDILVENGTMKIPKLTIEEDTESFFRNLIVYEQYYPKQTNLIIDYIKFMDNLINSEKDVELLCQKKIIHNYLGDDKVVVNMFNRLCDSVTMSSSSYYKRIYFEVNWHYRSRWNKWIASLRHNYFNTPWALISFIAAVLLLLFTLIQTVFSVAAYFK